MIVECIEKGGIFQRQVTIMTQDMWSVLRLFVAMRYVPNMTDGLSFEQALNLALAEDTRIWLVDDVGAIGIINIVPQEQAHVHITFWDKRLRGREDLCRVLADHVCQEFDLKGLITAVPKGRSVILAFAKRVGFRECGEYEQLTLLGAESEVFARCKNSDDTKEEVCLGHFQLQ